MAGVPASSHGGSVTAAGIEATFDAAGHIYQGTGAGSGALVYPPGYEIGYSQITAVVNITDTAEATATALITHGPFTYDGAAVMLDVYAAAVLCDTAAATDSVTFTLWEGATELGIIGGLRSDITATNNQSPLRLSYRFTPTAAAHTYKLCAFVTSTTGTPRIAAGAGGVTTYVPAFVRTTKV